MRSRSYFYKTAISTSHSEVLVAAAEQVLGYTCKSYTSLR